MCNLLIKLAGGANWSSFPSQLCFLVGYIKLHNVQKLAKIDPAVSSSSPVQMSAAVGHITNDTCWLPGVNLWLISVHDQMTNGAWVIAPSVVLFGD